MTQLIAVLMLFGLAGCQEREIRVREGFTSSQISHDEKIGLFVFKRERYYPGTMGLLGPGTPDEYIVNVSMIGTYDMATGAVRVLYRKDHGNRWVDETNDMRIADVFGSRASIYADGDYHWLDLNSGELTKFPLVEELTARGRGPGQVILVDEQGSLVLINKAFGQAMNYSAPYEIWLRRPNGEYERMVPGSANAGDYYDVKNNELYFYSPAERSYIAYNLQTRVRRKCAEKETPKRWAAGLTADFLTGDHGSPQPTIGKRVNGKWDRHPAQIDTSKLR